MTFEVTFWGVRGTLPCPMASHLGVGGNTSCVQLQIGNETIILDAGTGLRLLGQRLTALPGRSATLLLTHTHLDHISGFPFFQPFYDSSRSFRVMAGHLNGGSGIQTVLSSIMDRPLFPVPLRAMPATVTFDDFRCGEGFELAPGIRVQTAPLNHPSDGATAYRIDHAGRSVAFVTDTEHVPGRPDEHVLKLIEDADVVIYDATFTDAEFPARVGWGHSTWEEGVRLAGAAGARRLALFHHSPDHDDVFMDKVEAAARRDGGEEAPDVFVAREGMTLRLD